jgi:hypothetical protein
LATRNPDQASILCIPHVNAIIVRTEKATLIFLLHQQENFATTYCIYLPSPAYYDHPTSANYLIRISAMSFCQTKHPYGDVKAVIDRERNITEKTYRKM